MTKIKNYVYENKGLESYFGDIFKEHFVQTF